MTRASRNRRGSSKNRRQAAERRGRQGEDLAALWLMLKGYRILARRARTPFGEVDIAARKGDVLAIVEVKVRADLAAAAGAIPHRNQRRIAEAGEALAQSLRLKGVKLRYDLMVVSGPSLPRHIRDAWRISPP
jgi:putative endonuclease